MSLSQAVLIIEATLYTCIFWHVRYCIYFFLHSMTSSSVYPVLQSVLCSPPKAPRIAWLDVKGPSSSSSPSPPLSHGGSLCSPVHHVIEEKVTQDEPATSSVSSCSASCVCTFIDGDNVRGGEVCSRDDGGNDDVSVSFPPLLFLSLLPPLSLSSSLSPPSSLSPSLSLSLPFSHGSLLYFTNISHYL